MLPVLKELVPLLALLLTGALGMATYAWQQSLERRTAIAERRQQLYEILLGDLFGLLVAGPGVARSGLVAHIERCWLFGSDEVLKACYTYLEVYDRLCTKSGGDVLEAVRSSPEARAELDLSIASIFLAMRRDIRPTQVDDSWAIEHTKIYDWGIIAALDSSDTADQAGSREAGMGATLPSDKS